MDKKQADKYLQKQRGTTKFGFLNKLKKKKDVGLVVENVDE